MKYCDGYINTATDVYVNTARDMLNIARDNLC